MTNIKSIFTAAAMLLILAACPVKASASTSGYLLADSSYEYISEEKVAGWTSQALCYARNEIYARNGKTFYSQELQSYFDSQYWYHGIYTPDQFTDSMLNVYETANIQTLLSLEQAQGEYLLDQPGYSFDDLGPYMESDQANLACSASEGQAADTSAAGPDLSQDSYYVDPNSYIFADSSDRLLTSDEIGLLSLQELCYARYEIYARYGLIFSSTELSDYFNAKNWYWGTVDASSWSDSFLSQTEQENVLALKTAEMNQGGYMTDQPGYTYEGIGSYTSGAGADVSEQDYIFYDSQVRYLTESDLAGLSLQTLCYARNEIYARRGYIFQSAELRDYFGSKPWYLPTVPADSFSESVFNEIERANIELLKSREYALDPNGYQLY